MKCLKSDNGGEYCSKEFDDYCSYHGIRREKTVLGTPQANGVSERMNKVDAVDIVFYLINRGPSSSLEGRIP